MENYKETFQYGVDARSTYVTITNTDYNYKFKIDDVEEGVVITVKMYAGDDEIALSESDGYYVYSSTSGEYCETKEYIIKVTVDDELVQKINVTQVNIHQQSQGGGSVEVPTKLSELTNDVGYQNEGEVQSMIGIAVTDVLDEEF